MHHVARFSMFVRAPYQFQRLFKSIGQRRGVVAKATRLSTAVQLNTRFSELLHADQRLVYCHSFIYAAEVLVPQLKVSS